MRKRGSLNVGMRVERGAALLAYIINHAIGGNSKMDDYMPHADEQFGTVEDVMMILTTGRDR